MPVTPEDPSVSGPSWLDPGAFEVSPSIFRIPLPLNLHGLQAVNVYAVVDESGLVLVDAGWADPASLARLTALLAAIGQDVADVSRILVTHMHGDHYSQAISLRSRHGTPVALGVGEEPNVSVVEEALRTEQPIVPLEGRLGRAGAADLLTELLERSTGPEEVEFGRPDVWLQDDDTIRLAGRELTVLATPGHTKGHVVFRDAAAGVLFGGDHVLSRITPSIGFEPAPTETPLHDYLASLARVRALPDTVLLPAHGPVLPSTHQRIDELLQHHDQRFTEILSFLAVEPATAAAVAGRLRWTRRGRALDELDLFNRALAVAETLVHLDVLESRGQVTGRPEADGSVVWAA